jgi:hypothetical protein
LMTDQRSEMAFRQNISIVLCSSPKCHKFVIFLPTIL